MHWNNIVSKVSPYIVKIETPDGYGTGFLYMYNHDKSWCGVATAAHVIEHADKWNQPIKIFHPESKTSIMLHSSTSATRIDEPIKTMRVIFISPDSDSAVILFRSKLISLPENIIPAFPLNNTVPIGSEIGWLGFPQIADTSLCFFSGNISAELNGAGQYLIDGVAINGVSGGPVFLFTKPNDNLKIIGIITEYISNRHNNKTLPGLAVAQNVTHFKEVIAQVGDIDKTINKSSTIGADVLATKREP